MRVAVIGAGVAGLTAASALAERGHAVSVLDKGRRPGGRLATRELAGGARADHGAQFFTVRSREFEAAVAAWIDDGTVREWCRGFGSGDGHPRFIAPGGMARLAARMAAGLDVRSSTRVDVLEREGGGWRLRWAAAHGAPGGSMAADVLLLSAPVPQSAALLGELASLPAQEYEPMIALLLELDGAPAVPAPGAVQLADDATWSWVADNRAKGASALPALTLHTRADVARARFRQDDESLTAELLAAAESWLGGASVTARALHRWRYATPRHQQPGRCLSFDSIGLTLAGDAFGEPRVEGAFLSGLAAAEAIARRAG